MVLAWCPSRMPESEPVLVNATEQCELLATAHKEAEAFKDLAQRKCEELDAEVAALQTDLREREAYMATQQAALSAMEEEAHAQAAADAQDEARFRGDLQALIDAHLLPPLAAARQMARDAAGVVGESGRAEEAERFRLGREVIPCDDAGDDGYLLLRRRDDDVYLFLHRREAKARRGDGE